MSEATNNAGGAVRVAEADAILTVRGLSVTYGATKALAGVDLDLHPGRLTGLIGPNGAGKSTFIDAVTGFLPQATGSVILSGQAIERQRPSARARAGLSRTFQSPHLFSDLTIHENLLVAGEPARWFDPAADFFTGRRRAHGEKVVEETLDFLGLTDVAGLRPSELSLGQQRLVALGRALTGAPRVLLMDEPAAGLDNDESEILGARLRDLARTGISLLLVDHDMNLVLSVCDDVHVLEFGRMIATGTPDQIRRDPVVIAAYLGDEVEDVSTGAVVLEFPDSQHDASVVQASPAQEEERRGDVLLEFTDVYTGYEGQPVVRGLNLRVHSGEVVALLGPNGAGKTTSLLTASGILPLISGRIEIMGASPQHRKPWRVARRGVAHVPEDRALFHQLTVAENLRLAGGRADLSLATDRFPALGPLMSRRAGLLSGGEQQMLAIGRALMTEPRLLIVDEMSLGLAPIIVQRLLPVLRQVADESDTAVLLVEQHVDLALGMADWAYVLSHGDLVEDSSAKALSNMRGSLTARYLGNDPAGSAAE